ncbi:MAG: hypothetical protein WEC84_01200 [Candidatus Andersenbacteria bacterium]
MNQKIPSYIALISLPLFLLPVPKAISLGLFAVALILFAFQMPRRYLTLLGIFALITAAALTFPLSFLSPLPPLIHFALALATWSLLLLVAILFWSKQYKRSGNEEKR